MATGYGVVERQYAPYVSPFDFGFINQALAAKQQRYDANTQAIQDQLDAMVGVDMAKEGDKKYFYDKMSGLVSDINAYARNADLSSAGITRSIRSRITGALGDEKVMNGILGTQALRKYQAEVEWYKKNKPEQYAALNEADGMAPFIAWMSDGQIGSKLRGNGSYTPYVDIEGKLNKSIQELMKAKGTKQVFEVANGGYIQKLTVDEMSAADVMNFVAGSLNAQDRAQMAINARASYRMNPESYSRESMDKMTQAMLKEYDNRIGAAQASAALASGIDKQIWERKMAELQSSKAQYQTNVTAMMSNYDPQEGAMFMEQERLKNGMANKWAYSNISQETRSDATWVANKNLELNWFKAKHDVIHKQAVLDEQIRANKEKEKLARETLQYKKDKDKAKKDAAVAGGHTMQKLTLDEKETNMETYLNVELGVYKEFRDAANELVEMVKKHKGEYGEGFAESMKVYGGITDPAEAVYQFILSTKGKDIGNIQGVSDKIDALLLAANKKNAIVAASSESFENFFKDKANKENIDKYKKTTHMYDRDGRLIAPNDNPSDDVVKANMMADMIQLNAKPGILHSTQTTPETLDLVQQMARALGETVSYEDIFTKENKIKAEQTSATGKILLATMQRKGRNQGGVLGLGKDKSDETAVEDIYQNYIKHRNDIADRFVANKEIEIEVPIVNSQHPNHRKIKELLDVKFNEEGWAKRRRYREGATQTEKNNETFTLEVDKNLNDVWVRSTMNDIGMRFSLSEIEDAGVHINIPRAAPVYPANYTPDPALNISYNNEWDDPDGMDARKAFLELNEKQGGTLINDNNEVTEIGAFVVQAIKNANKFSIQPEHLPTGGYRFNLLNKNKSIISYFDNPNINNWQDVANDFAKNSQNYYTGILAVIINDYVADISGYPGATGAYKEMMRAMEN
jgi:hypothetical protein